MAQTYNKKMNVITLCMNIQNILYRVKFGV